MRRLARGLLFLAAVMAAMPAASQPATPPNLLDNQIGLPLKPGSNWRDRVRFMNEASSHYFRSRPVNSGAVVLFFPPVPPPLGSEIPILARLTTGPSAPPGLAGYEGDLFYPILAERLASDSLYPAIAARLQAYRSAKLDLEAELRAKIAELADADAPAREQQLALFASAQAPRIAELESTAERLRRDLQLGGVAAILTGSPEWRERPPGPPQAENDASPKPEDLHMEAFNLRGTAFYQEGLSPEQRRLLVETSIEIETPTEEEWAPGSRQLGDRLLPFSPEPARIRLPANLAEPTAEKIGRYILEKGRLKTELLDALRKNPDTASGARTQALSQLAAAQSGRIAEIERIAEDVRRDLALLPNPAVPPTPPPLPADIADRISAYRRHKVEVLRELRDLLVADTPAPAGSRDGSDGDPDPNAFAWVRDGRTRIEVQATSLQGSIDKFNARQEELIAGLNRELAAIRKDLSEYVRSRNPALGGKSIDDLVKDFEDARQKQELWDRYRDYRDAVLMPGLSPAQRRLLFDAAAGQLALPAGETAP